MESHLTELENPLKRHFYFPLIELNNLPKKYEWQWNKNGTYTNADRVSFPILTQLEDGDFLDLRTAISNYEDVIYANRDYQIAEKTRKVYCAHLIQHLSKVRSILKKNNDKVSDRGDKISGIRDQGYHRCRAMIIVPTRHSALEIVKCLRSLMPKHKVNKNWKEFIKEYTEEVEEDETKSDDNEEDEDDSEEDVDKKESFAKIIEKLKLSKLKHVVKKTGIDFDEWKLGNTNENFVFGLAIDKKLFEVKTKFINSDIIIGSPIGLRHIFADRKNYLNQLAITSSIEMLIMDQVEYMMVQNFDNIYPILEKLNQTPHGDGDVVNSMNSTMRVYKWALGKQARSYRQNIIISATLHPFIKKIMSFCNNFQGMNIFFPLLRLDKSLIKDCPLQLKSTDEKPPTNKKPKLAITGNIVFERLEFSCPVPETLHQVEPLATDMLVDMKPADTAHSVFKRKLVPLLINKLNQGGVLIYFTKTDDLYKIHRMLQMENLNISVVSEDVPENEIEKTISLFAKGAIKYLLLSERYYALTRTRFSAAQHLIYFSTPTFLKFAKDFHDFMLFRSRASRELPHHVIALCENELFDRINSKLAFKCLYGQ